MRWLVIACLVGLTAPAWGASKADEKQRQLDERYRLCVESCVKPVPRVGREQDVWDKNVRDEAHYDNCVHNCDRKYLRGFRK
jgi:hypothetical protein